MHVLTNRTRDYFRYASSTMITVSLIQTLLIPGMLSFTVYFLLKNPVAMRKLREEIDEKIGDRPVTIKDLNQLPYLIGLFKVTMSRCMRLMFMLSQLSCAKVYAWSPPRLHVPSPPKRIPSLVGSMLFRKVNPSSSIHTASSVTPRYGEKTQIYSVQNACWMGDSKPYRCAYPFSRGCPVSNA